MNMTYHEFHNALRILRSIDHYEVSWMDDEQWTQFRDHPYETFITMPQADSMGVFEALKARMK